MTNLPAEIDALTHKQRAFIHHYLFTLNSHEAALLAGYSERSARQMGVENLSKPSIRNAIETSFQANVMAPNEIMARLSAQARGDIADAIDDYGNVDINKARKLHASHLVKSYTNDETITENVFSEDGKLLERGAKNTKQSVTMYDSQKALIQLARIYALFNDRVEVTHRDPIKEQAIADIKAGVIVYEALADVVGDNEATTLFRLAGKTEAIPESAGPVGDDANSDAAALPAPADDSQ